MKILKGWAHPVQACLLKLLSHYKVGPSGLTPYYSDVLDTTEYIIEHARDMESWCQQLHGQLSNHTQQHMTRIMYMLTIVTTMFVPAQFVTGVYGMNFMYIPELQFPHAYAVFWAVICAFFLIGGTLLRKLSL